MRQKEYYLFVRERERGGGDLCRLWLSRLHMLSGSLLPIDAPDLDSFVIFATYNNLFSGLASWM